MQKSLLERYSITFIFCTCVTAVIDALFIAAAFCNFHLIYILNRNELLESIRDVLFFDRDVFLVDFYAFFLLFVVALFFMLFAKKGGIIVLALLLSAVGADLCLYTVNALFTIKLFIFSAWILTVGIKFPPKFCAFILPLGIVSFIAMQFYPRVLGLVDMADAPSIQGWDDFAALVFSFISVAVFVCVYRFAVCSWQESDAIRKHQNMVMSQLTVVNQQLQDLAKNKGEKAAEEERLRITRDMHDSCGYVFVNIIGLMEACQSGKPQPWDKTKECFEMVRSLASHGLQETRKTLRAIRAIRHPVETLDSLSEIKNIFQKVANVQVELDRGNMKRDYGRTINKILIRTMQEGLTNAVRHGLATYVAIYFREDDGFLYMTVSDNGVGSKQVVKGIGLAGMEERLRPVGGELVAVSGEEGGFRLEIKIPVMQLLMEEYGKTQSSLG